MIQQVNLYREELRGRRVPLSAARLAAALAVLVVLLLGWYGALRWQLAGAAEALAGLRGELQSRQADLTRLSGQLAARRAGEGLRAQIDQARGELQGKRWLLGVLGGERPVGAAGFSPYLEGLGRRRLDGLWLTDIVIADGGGQLALKGRALDANLLPRYLQALGTEPAYRGRQFNVFRLARPDPDDGALEFSLATRCRAADGAVLQEGICEHLEEGAG